MEFTLSCGCMVQQTQENRQSHNPSQYGNLDCQASEGFDKYIPEGRCQLY